MRIKVKYLNTFAMSTENSKRNSKVKTLKKELCFIGEISLGLFSNTILW